MIYGNLIQKTGSTRVCGNIETLYEGLGFKEN
jgi:DNA-binding transcriptional regulator PaaX